MTTTSTTRTGDIGDCYEYDRAGRMLADCDRGTIDYMIRLSAKWPDTYHRYVDSRGYSVWARAGREIPAPDFARE